MSNDAGAETLQALSEARNFNAWMADAVRPFLGQRVLEIGAGTGNLTAFLSRGRSRYVATDIEAEHLARLRTRFQHLPNVCVQRLDVADENDFAALRRSVDTVVCINVLEHIQDDGAALRNVHSALVPGGRTVILAPLGPEIFGTLDQALGHVRRYRREELEVRLCETGFTVKQTLGFNRVSRPAWYVTGRLLKKTRLHPAPLKLFDRMVWLWRRIDRALPWPPMSIIAVADRS